MKRKLEIGEKSALDLARLQSEHQMVSFKLYRHWPVLQAEY